MTRGQNLFFSVRAATSFLLAFVFLPHGHSTVEATHIIQKFKDQAFRRIQSVAREDIAAIAENEEQLNVHVNEWLEVVSKVQSLLIEPANKLKTGTLKTAPKADVVKDRNKKEKKVNAGDSRVELANWERELKEQHDRTDSVKAALNNVMGPAMMVPVLQEMYGKFKGDIKKATQQEERAKDRVTQQESEYAQWQKEGKTYLLKDKQRVIDYYKKQREIQHHHYHAMLKMAHGMMTRIKEVKEMCGKAASGQSLSEKEKQDLRMMAPNKGK